MGKFQALLALQWRKNASVSPNLLPHIQALLSPFGRPSSWKVGSLVGGMEHRTERASKLEAEAAAASAVAAAAAAVVLHFSARQSFARPGGNRAKRGEWGQRCPRFL